jgi:hypothetical protein
MEPDIAHILESLTLSKTEIGKLKNMHWVSNLKSFECDSTALPLYHWDSWFITMYI